MPRQRKTFEEALEMIRGSRHFCILDAAGTQYCWTPAGYLRKRKSTPAAAWAPCPTNLTPKGPYVRRKLRLPVCTVPAVAAAGEEWEAQMPGYKITVVCGDEALLVRVGCLLRLYVAQDAPGGLRWVEGVVRALRDNILFSKVSHD
jgi:hypothetical protein